MPRSIQLLLWLCLLGPVLATAADDTARPAQAEHSCAGVANEVSKGRELNRELNVYAGQTVPAELQQRVLKHLALVAQRKSECDQSKEQALLKK